MTDDINLVDGYVAGIQAVSWPHGRTIAVEGALLVAGAPRPGAGREKVRLPDLLERFAALGNTPDARVAAFASRHGLLGVCPHGLARHAWTDVHADPAIFRWCRRGREPIALWRDLAAAAGAAMALAADLHAGREGSGADVAALAPFLALWREPGEREQRELAKAPGYVRPLPPELGARAPRDVLAAFLDAWMITARVAPTLRWGKGLPRVQLAPREPRLGLLAALGITLMGRVTRSVRPDFCHACGAPLTRRARRGTRSFCKRSACQRVKRNLHQAEYRARQRGGA